MPALQYYVSLSRSFCFQITLLNCIKLTSIYSNAIFEANFSYKYKRDISEKLYFILSDISDNCKNCKNVFND